MSKVAEVHGTLPDGAKQPVIQKDTGQSTDLMYISFSSDKMTPEQITDYITRAVVPQLETVSGVSKAEVLGAKTFAMRIWLNPVKMAALNISPTDISQSLLNNNYQSSCW